MTTLSFKVRKYTELAQEINAEYITQGIMNSSKATEMLNLREELQADLNSALDYSAPYLHKVGDEIREAIYQQAKEVKQPRTTQAESTAE